MVDEKGKSAGGGLIIGEWLAPLRSRFSLLLRFSTPSSPYHRKFDNS